MPLESSTGTTAGTECGLARCEERFHIPLGEPGRFRRKPASPHLEGFTREVYPERSDHPSGADHGRAAKQLRKLPRHIVNNLMIWVMAVEQDGLDDVRKIPGYHDEPLKGDRIGQRSIRLSRAYRAIYEIKGDTTRFVTVEEVRKHEY